MTIVLSVCVAVIMGVSIFLMLGRELKEVAMGLFLVSHAAHLSILSMSGSPLRPIDLNDDNLAIHDGATKSPPVIPGPDVGAQPLQNFVDPLPQALILTSIVISFAVMAFILTLLIVTVRANRTAEIDQLAKLHGPTPSQVH